MPKQLPIAIFLMELYTATQGSRQNQDSRSDRQKRGISQETVHRVSLSLLLPNPSLLSSFQPLPHLGEALVPDCAVGALELWLAALELLSSRPCWNLSLRGLRNGFRRNGMIR